MKSKTRKDHCRFISHDAPSVSNWLNWWPGTRVEGRSDSLPWTGGVWSPCNKWGQSLVAQDVSTPWGKAAGTFWLVWKPPMFAGVGKFLLSFSSHCSQSVWSWERQPREGCFGKKCGRDSPAQHVEFSQRMPLELLVTDDENKRNRKKLNGIKKKEKKKPN